MSSNPFSDILGFYPEERKKNMKSASKKIFIPEEGRKHHGGNNRKLYKIYNMFTGETIHDLDFEQVMKELNIDNRTTFRNWYRYKVPVNIHWLIFGEDDIILLEEIKYKIRRSKQVEQIRDMLAEGKILPSLIAEELNMLRNQVVTAIRDIGYKFIYDYNKKAKLVALVEVDGEKCFKPYPSRDAACKDLRISPATVTKSIKTGKAHGRKHKYKFALL